VSERRGKKKLEEKAVKEAIGAWSKGEVVGAHIGIRSKS